MEVNGCGMWRSRGHRVRSLPNIHHEGSCDLCRFFRDLKTAPRNSRSRLDLCAYSARAAFHIPRGVIPDTVMLAVIPGLRSKDRKNHPLQYGRIIMECAENQGRITGRQIGSQVDFGLVKSWLDFCAAHHSRLCQRENVASVAAFRVIDCFTRKVVHWSHLPKPAEFVALSYVWGDIKDDCSVVNGCLPKHLPRLIEDAIELTTKLGFKYLWIDRYCIPQDNAKERHMQIQSMNLIYGSSAVTVIAMAGVDPTHGLPGVGSTPRREQHSIRIGCRTLVSTSLDIARQVMNSKWDSRCWTYQEAYLSTRRLAFTDRMVYFQCCAMHCLETISAPLTALHTRGLEHMRDSVDISRLWPLRGLGKHPADLEERIIEYASRELSFPSDALNAFEGVLRKFKTMEHPVRNICGVPVFDSNDITASLVIGLSWWVYSNALRSIRPYVRKRPGFPSWSWAGWSFKIPGFLHALEFSLHNHEPGREQTKFRQDKLTLKQTTSLVDIDMEMADGTLLPWAQASDLIMYMASSGRNPPEVLRITGYTADARIRARDGSGSYNHLRNETDDQYSFLGSSRIVHPHPFRMVELAEDMGVQPLAAEAAEQFYHFRFIVLGFMEDVGLSGRPNDIIMTMVAHRREGSATYERLAVLRRNSRYEGTMLREMKQGATKTFEGWKKCETRIA